MIKIHNLCVTISALDCPNLHYKFDFSGFYNQYLAEECVRLFEQKYENGVSVTYLSVLSTAFTHFGEYLQANQCTGIISYTENERMRYYSHLNSLYKKDERVYSRNYIRFLAFVPRLLCGSEVPAYE